MQKQQEKNPTSLLLSLYLHSHQVPSPYTSLHQFRQKIEQAKSAPHHKPYHAVKAKAQAYQLIFLSLSIVFTILFFIVYSYTRNPYISLLSMNFALPKVVGCFFSVFCAFASMVVGLSIRVEKEAISKLIGRAKQRLRRTVHSQYTQISARNRLTVFNKYKLMNILRQHHKLALDKIAESQEIALILLQKITECPESATQLKETLYNEAILELDENLQFILAQFQDEISSIQV